MNIKIDFDFWIKVDLERIHYIQRGGSLTSRRAAQNYYSNNLVSQTMKSDYYERKNDRVLEIFYSTDNPRTDYLYKSISFQLIKTG